MSLIKKLFLSIILVMTVVTPVFAVFETQSNTTGSVADACIESQLGTDVGPATIEAKWTPNQVELIWNATGGTFSNMISSHPAHTWEQNGITITTAGDGVYVINGTATAAVTITVSIDEFIIPVSKGQGGTGAIAFYNNQANTNITLRLYNNNTQSDSWMLSPVNRFNNSYSAMANKTINQLRFSIPSGISVSNFTVAPAIYNDSRTSAGTFGVGSPSGGTAENTCTYDGDITLPSQPSRTGFSFAGWKLEE